MTPIMAPPPPHLQPIVAPPLPPEVEVQISKEKVKSILNEHLQKRSAIHHWLYESINESNVYFPYTAKDGHATVIQEVLQPGIQSAILPKVMQNGTPNYLVNVPIAHRLAEQGYAQFNRLMNLYKNESFEKSEAVSRGMIQERFALVIGVNQIESLDPEMNRCFKEWICNIPLIGGIAYRVFGFYWKPSWKIRDLKRRKKRNLYNYESSEAFLILKALSAAAAERVRAKLEGEPGKLSSDLRNQIPFQRIREKIKNSDYAESFAKSFAQTAPSSPLYYGVMDADALRLRIKDGAGLFTRFDQTIADHENPSVVTHGYSVEEPDNPLIELGVRLDMTCRAAMTKEISYGAYFPEPASLFRVKEADGKLRLSEMSFIGEGQTLENRRLIQNGLKKKILEQDAVFVADGGVVTTTPARMETIKNSKVTKLTTKNLKHQENLRALRSISQSHIHPKHWADNLYIALNFKVPKVTNATKQMMFLFSVYDPLSRMFDISNVSETVFDNVFNNYYGPLSEAQKVTKDKAQRALIKLGMKKEMVDKIVKAAEASGKAIYELLKKVLEEEV